MDFIVLILLFVIFFDIALLKKQDRELFIEAFVISPGKALFSALIILVILFYSEDKSSDLPLIILLFIVPMYLLKRNHFTLKLQHVVKTSLRLCSSALGVIVSWTYGIAVFGLFMTGVMSLFSNAISEMGDLVLTAIFSSALIIVLVYRSSKQFSDKGFLINVGLCKGQKEWSKVIPLAVLLGLFFACISSYLVVSRQVQPQTPLNDVLETTQSMYMIMGFLLLAIGVAPLIEEIVFRGYFFRVIKEWIGVQKTIYVIAITFAFLHVGQYWGDWLAIMMVTVLGFTLTLLRAWSGSTVASVITHYVYNGGVTIIPIIMIAISNPAYLDYRINFFDYDAHTKEVLLRESIADQPDFFDAYNDLAWLYAGEETNLGEALELIEKALEVSPQRPAYLDTKAEVLEKLGRFDEAQLIRDQLVGKLP